MVAGELRLDGSVGFGSGDFIDEDTLLATLVFTVAEECTPVSLAFDLTQAFDSELSNLGTALTTSLLDSSPSIPDATAPVIGAVADITVAADAGVGGGCASAVVAYPTPGATDNCSTPTVECFPPSGTAFPAGVTTQVSCVATDECGNVSIKTFDVTVTNTNVVDLSIDLVGVIEPSVSRCIHFVLTDDCGATADVSLPFTSGSFTGSIEVPCGTWTGICAKDQQHTMWDTVPLVLAGGGTKWAAVGTLELEPGDTDDDGDVDINDVTLLLAQYSLPASAGGCPWDTITRDADFSDSGVVFSEDYVLLSGNWLMSSSCACTSPAVNPRERLAAFTPVRDALTEAADLNRDGWVDARDVEVLEQRYGLSGDLSAAMRASENR